MALRDKMAERAQPFLEPGEQIQVVFMAQAGRRNRVPVEPHEVAAYEIVAVTDRAIVVLDCGGHRLDPRKLRLLPREVSARLPRDHELGPLRGGLWSPVALPGPLYHFVPRRFYPEVRAADAGRGWAS